MNPEKSLYDRLGGEETVNQLIDVFYDRVLKDEELARFFAGSEMKHQTSMFREFIASALDGPAKYTGKSIAESHQGRGIKPRHMQKFVDLLLESILDFGVPRRDVDLIIARVNTYSDEVTGDGAIDG